MEPVRSSRPSQVATLIKSQMSPLEYMLTVMCDPNASPNRRDRMAIAAAPYCHAKLSDLQSKGKKDQRIEAAETAGMGTAWAEDLEFDGRLS